MQIVYTVGLLFPGNKEECISTLETLKCMVSPWPLMRVCRSSRALQKIPGFSFYFLAGSKEKRRVCCVCVIPYRNTIFGIITVFH